MKLRLMQWISMIHSVIVSVILYSCQHLCVYAGFLDCGLTCFQFENIERDKSDALFFSRAADRSSSSLLRDAQSQYEELVQIRYCGGQWQYYGGNFLKFIVIRCCCQTVCWWKLLNISLSIMFPSLPIRARAEPNNTWDYCRVSLSMKEGIACFH